MARNKGLKGSVRLASKFIIGISTPKRVDHSDKVGATSFCKINEKPPACRMNYFRSGNFCHFNDVPSHRSISIVGLSGSEIKESLPVIRTIKYYCFVTIIIHNN